MADDVQVQFGASIDRLIRGVEQSKEAISNFAEQTQHSFEKVKEFGETVMEAFAVERIAEFVEKMAQLGTTTERTMSLLGVSAEAVGRLDFIAKATGGSLEMLTSTTERMALNIQKAGANAFSPAALALQKLHLSAKDFAGLAADQYILKIADAASKFNKDFDLAQVLMALGGKGMAELIPVIAEGRAGIEELGHKADETRSTLSGAMVASLVSVHHSIVELQGAMTGLGATIVSAFAPSITAGMHAITGFVSQITLAIQGGQFWARELEGIREAVAELGVWLLRLGALAKDVFTLNWADINSHWDNGAKLLEETMAEHAERLKKIMEDAEHGIASPGGHGAGEQKPDIGQLGIVDHDTIGAAMKEIDGQIKVLQQGLAQKKIILDAEAKQFAITEDQKFKSLEASTEKQYQLELALLQKELQIGGLKATQRVEVNNKIKELEAKHTTEMIKLDSESIAAMQAKWTSFLGSIEGAFNSQLRGLLAGTTTWAQAFKNIMGDLLIKFIETVEKMALEWGAAQLAQTTATTTGAATRAVAEQGAMESTLPARAGKFISDITANAALTFAGIMANLSPIIGPAAAGPAAAGQATVLAELASVPKLDIGGFVLSSGLAMIHRGETVTPAAKVASPYGGGAGGGGDTHVHVSAWDGASVQRWLNTGGAMQIARAIGAKTSLNPSLALA